MNLLIAKRALGLFSIGLGLVAVASPERVSRFFGLKFEDEAMSAFGAREIASGAGLLSPVKPGPWFWMRVGGDVMDITALARAMDRDNPRRKYAIAALVTVAGIAILDFAMAAQATMSRRDNEAAAA